MGVFIVNPEHISLLFLVFLGLPLNKQMLTGKMLRGQCWVMAVFDMFGNSMGVS